MTPQQQADEMARKCAKNIDLVQEVQGVRQMHELQGIITQSLPLVQLLECVEVLRLLAKINEQLNRPSLTPIAKDRLELIRNALTDLDRTMKGEKV